VSFPAAASSNPALSSQLGIFMYAKKEGFLLTYLQNNVGQCYDLGRKWRNSKF
jgi:hypothetical protein